MALTYVGASTIVYSTGNPVTTAAANAIDDLLILAVGTKPDTTPATTPSGWTQLLGVAGGTGTTGIDTGPMRIGIFYKVATSANETAGTVTVTGNNVSTAQIFAYRAGAGNTFDIAGTAAGDTTTGTAFSAAMPVNPGMTVADELLAFGVAPTDAATYSAQTVAATGMTTVTLTEINEWVTASGQDMGGWVARGPVVTGTATAVPTVSSTAAGTTTNVAGVLALVRVREVVITAKSGSETGTFSASTESSSLNASTPTNPTFVAVTPTGVWNTTTSPKATAALNVLAGDILVDVSASADIYATGTDAVNTTNSGTAQTWTKRQTITAPLDANCFAQITTATQGNTDSAETVTDTYSSSGSLPLWGHQVLQFRNSNGIGASTKSTSGTAGTLSLTTTQDNSAIVVIVADWSAVDGSTRTWATVNGFTPTSGNGYETTYAFLSGQYTVYVAYYPDAGAAGAKTVGVSSPGSMTPSIVAIEVKGASGAASTPVTASDAGTFSVTGVSDSTVSSALTDSGTFSATETSTSSSTLSRTDTGTFSATDTSGLVVALTANDTGTFSATETSALAITNAISTTDAGTFSAGTETSSSTSTLSRTDTGTFSATETSSLVINNGVSAVDSGTFSVSAVAALSSVGSTTDSGTLSDTETSSLLSLSTTSDNGTLSATESSSIVGQAIVSASDTGTLDVTGTANVFVTLSATDTGTVSVTEAADAAPQGTTTYRIYESATPPTTAADDFVAVTLGVEFYVTSDATLTEIRWWQPDPGGATNTSQRQGGVWRVSDVTSLGTTPSVTPSGSGWQTLTFATPVALAANTRYRVGVYHPNGGYTATGAYYSGGADETNGPLVIPKAANATGLAQGTYNYNAGLAYPSNTFNATNYWIDVTVSTAGGTTIKSGADSGTFSATETAAVSSTITANDSGTFSATENASGTSTQATSDSGTFSATESASLVVSLSSTDTGTFSVTDTSASSSTLAANETGTFSATEAINKNVTSPDSGTFSATDTSSLTVIFTRTDTGTFSATETSASSSTLAATDSGFFQASGETSGLAATSPTSDSGTFSATETAVLLITSARSDNGTFSATDTSGLTGVATVSTTDAGTFSASGEVSSLAIITAKAANDTGTFSATETSALNKNIGANDTGTFSVTEARTLAATTPSSDTGAFSATESASILVTSQASDAGTFTDTEQAGLYFDATSSSADSGTLSATENAVLAFGIFADSADSGTLSITEQATLVQGDAELVRISANDGGTLSAEEKQIEFFKQQYIEPAVLPFIERPGPKPIRQFHSRFTPKFIRLWRP